MFQPRGKVGVMRARGSVSFLLLAQVFLQSYQTGLEFQRGRQERELLALNKGTQVALSLTSRKR